MLRAKSVSWVVAPVLPALLLAAYPLLSLFEQNQSELPLSVIWSPLVVMSAAIVVLYAVLVRVLRDARKAGVLTAVAVLFFFYLDTFHSDVAGLHLSDGSALVIWLALCGTVGVLLARMNSSVGTVLVGVGVAAAVLALVPALRVASYQRRHPAVSASDPRLWPTPLTPSAKPRSRPDIYVIIPDDYARGDVLKRYFHYDNAAFVRALKHRGLTLSDQARSPYSDSESNITAELNMGYLTGLPKILGPKSQDVRPLKTLMEDNRAAQLAKSLGYRYHHMDTDEVMFSGGNPAISPVGVPDSFQSLWLRKSVLRVFGGPIGFNESAGDQRFRDTVRSGFKRLDHVISQPGPKLVAFHTLIPHDPYIFGARGQSVTFPSQSDDVIHSRLGMRYYLPQVRYVERRLLSTVDQIRAHSRTPPVIVLMSDEGFEGGSTFSEAVTRDIRVKGLLAYSVPGLRHPAGPRPPSTVNTLRWVFNQVWGTRYPMLPAVSSPDGDYPYQWEPFKVAK